MPPSEVGETPPPSDAPEGIAPPSAEPVEGVGDGVGDLDAGEAVAVGVGGGPLDAEAAALREAREVGETDGVREFEDVSETVLEAGGVMLLDSEAPCDMDAVGVTLGVGVGDKVLVVVAVGVVEGVDVCVTAVGSTAHGAPV
jgi:hypothetical protein